MHTAAVLAIRALAGGALVVAFALLGHALRPKWFAGLFAAAPSIALASLIVTAVDKGSGAASQAALGMVFGAVGIVTFALTVRPLLARTHVLVASAAGCLVWLVVGVGSYLGALR